MTEQKTVFLCGESVPYELTYKWVKNINLRVRPDGSIAVSAPPTVPPEQIADFLIRNAERVLRARQRAAEEQEQRQKEAPEGQILLFGKPLNVSVTVGSARQAELSADGATLNLCLLPGDDGRRREALTEAFLRRSCAAAVTDCVLRLYPHYAARGVTFPEVRFRRMVSEWGNCRPKKHLLTFSTALAAVPPDCVELVVAHELTHFLVPDHSARFYEELAAVIPDYKKRISRMRAYHPR